MKNIKTGTYIYNGETFNFNFATSLLASEKISFVNSVVDIIIGDNYYSMIRNLIFDYMIIKTFTDIDTSFIGDSEDAVDIVEQFLDETNIVDIVKANIEVSLLEELNNAVDKAVEYRTGIHPSPITNSFASFFSTLEKKISEIDLGSAMEMIQRFTSMTGEFTPESLVNAYMNSDVHKNNIVEIEEVKKYREDFAKDMDKAIKAVKAETKTKAKSKSKK